MNPSFLAQVLALIDGAPRGGGGGSGLGSGVGNPNPSDRGPVSTTGEEFDPEIFDDDFRFDDLIEFLPEDYEIEEEFFCDPQDPGPGCF